MEITLTDAQFTVLKTLLDTAVNAQSHNSSAAGEVIIGADKIEWATDEVKFTIT
ncbi:hypothetical protein LCGC14_2334160 [marine sediment metagenome]|uniref:Uncharacterized protein n=1 Tax=marine sediment metagenome TaxID=412755 RepID=A0A0F9ERN5_9ZZZZ